MNTHLNKMLSAVALSLLVSSCCNAAQPAPAPAAGDTHIKTDTSSEECDLALEIAGHAGLVAAYTLAGNITDAEHTTRIIKEKLAELRSKRRLDKVEGHIAPKRTHDEQLEDELNQQT